VDVPLDGPLRSNNPNTWVVNDVTRMTKQVWPKSVKYKPQLVSALQEDEEGPPTFLVGTSVLTAFRLRCILEELSTLPVSERENLVWDNRNHNFARRPTASSLTQAQFFNLAPSAAGGSGGNMPPPPPVTPFPSATDDDDDEETQATPPKPPKSTVPSKTPAVSGKKTDKGNEQKTGGREDKRDSKKKKKERTKQEVERARRLKEIRGLPSDAEDEFTETDTSSSDDDNQDWETVDQTDDKNKRKKEQASEEESDASEEHRPQKPPKKKLVRYGPCSFLSHTRWEQSYMCCEFMFAEARQVWQGEEAPETPVGGRVGGLVGRFGEAAPQAAQESQQGRHSHFDIATTCDYRLEYLRSFVCSRRRRSGTSTVTLLPTRAMEKWPEESCW
jgi:hypothetical protein